MNNAFDSFQNSSAFYQPEYYMKKSLEKKSLKKLGEYTAMAILFSILMQNVIVVAVQLTGLYDRYFSDAYFSSAVDILVVILGMLLPFSFWGRKMKKASGALQPLMLDKPYKPFLVLPAVLAGLGFCMLGNIINSYITMFFSNMDVEFTSPEIPMAEGVSGIILTFFRVAVTAGVIEELCFRGHVMGNLRFYGDGFAVAASAIMFALLHGNMVQAPFALMAGTVLGYLSVKTGTIWTGIIIHVLNNSISLVTYYLGKHLGEQELLAVYALLLYGLIFIGAISFGLFLLRSKDYRISLGASTLTTAEKVRAYFLNIPMIVAIAYMLYVTAEYIKKGS